MFLSPPVHTLNQATSDSLTRQKVKSHTVIIRVAGFKEQTDEFTAHMHSIVRATLLVGVYTVPYRVLTKRGGWLERPWRVAVGGRCWWVEVKALFFATHTATMSRAVRHPGAVQHVPCQGREMICESWGSSQLMCAELCVPVQPG